MLHSLVLLILCNITISRGRLTLTTFLSDRQAEETTRLLCDGVVGFHLADGRQAACHRQRQGEKSKRHGSSHL